MPTLDPDRWRDAIPYVDQALDLPEEECAAWLNALRVRDAALAADVQTLLDEYRSLTRDGFLGRSPVAMAGEPLVEGRTLGAYTLVSPIGQGGMGSVWLARRSDGRYERSVAIKFPRIALPASGGERFKREGSLLGRLAHPHIADLIDAGVSPNGQPYLVLEHVDGKPLDQYCDERRLGLEARLRVFLDVLAAVDHAHAHLIVHRDIKPPNILVTADGHVKLLDFGIAKLLASDADAGAAEPLTREGGAAMTPEYAAPEQVTGGAVTTATDVYALGVVLYLLLTGRHPAGTGTRSPAELIKAIVETVPTRPSAVVELDSSGVGHDSPAVRASRRSLNPEKLRRALRGDLDTLVAKALKKDPRERYGSVAAFADDVRRYLRHEPLSARPDTLGYRAGKFVRRNRLSVALTTVALAATVAGVAGILIQARTARRQRDFALRQWSQAEAINDLDEFLGGEIGSSIPGETLDLAEHVLGLRQGGNPADRVEILIQLSSRSPLEKGNARHRRMAEEAYALSREVPEPAIRAKAACQLGMALAVESVMSEKTLVPRAEALIREGLGELPADPQYARERAFCLQNGSYVSRTAGSIDEAISRMRQAQQALDQAPSRSDAFELRVSQGLADALRFQGRWGEACAEYEKLSSRLTALGRGETGLGYSTDYKWGQSLNLLGRPQEAEKLVHLAIVGFSESEDDPDVLPWQLVTHAQALRDLGQLQRSAAEAEHAYAVAMKKDEQAFVTQALLLRASIERLGGNLDRARDLLAEAEPRLRGSLPAGDVGLAPLLSEQGLLAAARGNATTGLELMNQAVSIAEPAARTAHKGIELVPRFLTYRSEIELQLGRTDDAVADANRALALIQDVIQQGRASSSAGHAYLALGHALQAQNRPDQALAAFRSAVENLQSTLGPDHPDTRSARQLAGPGTPL